MLLNSLEADAEGVKSPGLVSNSVKTSGADHMRESWLLYMPTPVGYKVVFKIFIKCDYREQGLTGVTSTAKLQSVSHQPDCKWAAKETDLFSVLVTFLDIF